MKYAAKVFMLMFIIGGPVLITWAMFRSVPEGYEDEHGFHYGRPPGER